MKNELGITKGECSILETNEADEWVDVNSVKGIFARTFYGELEPIITKKEAELNANLISEAFNVANETGKTPRQLADDNKVLLETLRKFTILSEEHYSDIKGLIKNAKETIKQVTE